MLAGFREDLRVTRTPPHLATLVLLTALTVLSLNMFMPALPAMREDFGVSKAVMGLSISLYMACAAVFQLVLGRMSDRIGRRPVLLGVLIVYVAASVICLLSQSIGIFLAARSLQAVVIGGGLLASAVVRDMFEGRVAAAKLATIASAMAIAPMVGPLLGGFLDVAFGWRSVFALYSVLGLGALVLAFRDLGETRPIVISDDPPAGVMALLRERVFWAYTAVIGFGIGAFFIFLTGAPFVLADVYGLSSDQIGLGLGSTTAGFLAGSVLSSRLVVRIGPVPLILVGRILPLIGVSAGFVLFLAGAGSMWVLFAATLVVGFGNGLTVANSNAGVLSVRPDMAGTAAGIAGAAVLIMGALLSGAATTVLSAQASPERLMLLIWVAVAASLIAALLVRRWSRD